MNVTAEVPALLALDAGVRETGWAVFKNGEVIESGVTGLSTRRKVEPEVRISHLIESLNVLASQSQPQIVALCQPSGINWPVPALDLLVSSLAKRKSSPSTLRYTVSATDSSSTSNFDCPYRVCGAVSPELVAI